VRRLHAAENNVKGGQAPYGLGERVGGSQRIGSGEDPVGKEIAAVRSKHKRLAQYGFRLGWSHRDGRDRTSQLLLEPHGRLQRVGVVHVELGIGSFASEYTRLGIAVDLRTLRYLLDTDYKVHGRALRSSGPSRLAIFLTKGIHRMRMTLLPSKQSRRQVV